MPAITVAVLDAHRVDPTTLAVAPLMGIDHVEDEIASLVDRPSAPERAAHLGAEVPRNLASGPLACGHARTSNPWSQCAPASARRPRGRPLPRQLRPRSLAQEYTHD